MGPENTNIPDENKLIHQIKIIKNPKMELFIYVRKWAALDEFVLAWYVVAILTFSQPNPLFVQTWYTEFPGSVGQTDKILYMLNFWWF